MKAIMPDLNEKYSRALYLQLFDYIKKEILEKAIVPGEKLPSLRKLSETLGVSLTTVEMAYNQLLVEGYIYSKPQSGYYVSDMFYPKEQAKEKEAAGSGTINGSKMPEPNMLYDLSCFNFIKWKKCINKVINDYPQMLLFESDSRGEEILRYEISQYVYQSRGVKCIPEQIVIAAGTQQITTHLANILGRIFINHVAVEDPGYLPVINIFRDRGFVINPVRVVEDGISIDRLPTNIRSAVYVNPSNQFPTGAVMPVGKRYKLLDWAENNNSYIIEDDYDSELRYFGKPIPALQGLDRENRVIYLGSFSSTLFASAKISYMVLPETLSEIFGKIKGDYSQTCAKIEQLTLALFMEQGYYKAGIGKLRRLYSQKLQTVMKALPEDGFVAPLNATSGINMLINVKSHKPARKLCQEAKGLGVYTVPVDLYTEESSATALIFYYNRIPLDIMEKTLEKLLNKWRI